MLDHLGFGVSDIGASKSFFSAALAPLGISIVMDGEHGVGLGKNGKPALWLAPGGTRPSPMHIAFTAERRAEVDAFYRAALAAGGKDNGAPGLCPTTIPTITEPSSSDRTATTSRLSATRPRPRS